MSRTRGEDLEELHILWSNYAAERKLRSAPSAIGLPAFEGAAKGTAVTVAVVGSVELGFRTRATTSANVAMRGSVEVAPAGEWGALVRRVITRGFFGDAQLDRALVVKASSRALARTILDDRVVETIRALASVDLVLAYVNGAIRVEWAGIEREPRILDDVLDVLGYLAVRGPERSPYR